MARLPVRQTCPSNTQWYVCSAGNFRGCCSVDPCTTGVCPDEGNGDSTSVASTQTKTQKQTKQTQPASSTSTASDGATTTLIPTSAPTTAAVGPTSTLDHSLSTSMSPRAATSSPAVGAAKATSGANGVIIGAAVGSIVGFLILVSLVFFLIKRSRRKAGHQVSAYPLVFWGGQGAKRERRQRPAIVTNGRALKLKDLSGIKPPNGRPYTKKSSSRPTQASPTKPVTKPPTKPSPTKPSPISRTSPARPAARLPSAPARGSPVKTSPTQGVATRHSPIVKPPRASTTPTISSLSSSSTAVGSLPTHASTSSTLSIKLKHLPPIPQHRCPPKTPPELPDTGFYRQRAELAAYTSRELINIPRRQKLSDDDQDSPADGNGSVESPPLRQGPVVTADGVVLTANFEKTAGDEEMGVSPDGDKAAGSPPHVLSFMDYDPEWDAVVPAFHPAFRSD